MLLFQGRISNVCISYKMYISSRIWGLGVVGGGGGALFFFFPSVL